MARMTFSRTAALGAAALAAVAGLALSATSAGAITARVKEACSYDYHRFCPSYPPESAQARQCMRKVGRRLSPGCIDALADAGEIPRSKKR